MQASVGEEVSRVVGTFTPQIQRLNVNCEPVTTRTVNNSRTPSSHSCLMQFLYLLKKRLFVVIDITIDIDGLYY
jgi:hypothetical protein